MRTMRILLAIILALGVVPTLALAQRTPTRTSVIRLQSRGFLGFRFNYTAESRDGVMTENMIVREVVAGSPADQAGVRVGDRILRIDGKAISPSKFDALARTLQPGDTVRLRVASGDRERDITLEATERPAEYLSGGPIDELMLLRGDSIGKIARIYLDSARFRIDSLFKDSLFVRFRAGGPLIWLDTLGPRRFRFHLDSLPAAWRFDLDELRLPIDHGEFPRFEMMLGRSAVAGAEFTALNPGLSQYFGTDEGLLVLRVGPETPAARAGLEAGDVLTKVNARAIADVEEFRAAVARAAGSPLKLDIIRKGKARSLDLEVRRRR
jgi:predicted metalloprotease with PDZ domain